MKQPWLRNSLILLSILCTTKTIQSQTPFNKVFDFGYHQNNGRKLISTDSNIYVSGIVLTPDAVNNEREIFFAKLDSIGALISHQLYQDDNLYNSATNNARRMVQIGDDIFSGVIEVDINEGYGFILRYDTTIDSLDVLYYVQDTLHSNSAVFVSALAKSHDDNLAMFMGIDLLENQGILLEIIDAENGTQLNKFVFEKDDFAYVPMELAVVEDGYVLLGQHRSTGLFGLFAMKLDKELNLIKEVTYDNLNYSYPYINGVVDAQGDIVFQHGEFVPDPLSPFNLFRPVITKLSSELDILWQSNVDYEEYERGESATHFLAVVNSYNEDGYILAGMEPYPDSTVRSDGLIAKIDLDGEVVWKRTLQYLDEGYSTANEFYDAVATPDGHYMAVGLVRPAVWIDSVIIQSWIVKFDEEGHLVTIDTTSSNSTTFSPELRIYPNPSADVVYIEHDELAGVSYTLYNQEGQQVLGRDDTEAYHTYILDTSQFAVGTYYLHIMDADGRRYVEELVLMR